MEIFPGLIILDKKKIFMMELKSPDNKILALGTDNDKIYLFDVESAKVLHKLTGHSGNPIRCLDFTPDGKHLISGSDDETINIYDVYIS
jgi:WD40 repeat protein